MAPPDALAEELPKPILPPKPAGVRFLGSPTQRTAAKEKDEALAYAATLPAGPQRQAVEYFIKTGKAAPAGIFKTGDDTIPAYKLSPNRQVVEELQPDGKTWLPVTGGLKKDGHWVQEPTPLAPKDTSGHDRDTRNNAYNTAVRGLDKAAAPFEDQLKNLEMVDTVANDRSPTGDAHIAPMILKALVAGEGAGFRMTKSEIDEVKNARSHWDSMAAAFRKWDSGDKGALFFGEPQRQEFLHLIATVRTVAARHLEQVNATRNDLDVAQTAEDIQKRITRFHQERAAPKSDDKAEPKRVRYDINGKVVK
jgi:hypothetical protein